jgi:hypothetical protein
MNDFARRLRAARKAARMTTADLRIWFDRPYATVRSWIVNDRQPHGPAGHAAFLRLRHLERKIEHGFTVPVSLSSRERPRYIKRLCHAQRAGVSELRAAG